MLVVWFQGGSLGSNDSQGSSSQQQQQPPIKMNNRMPGNIVCGICGAVRYYAFILQAKKFGTFSCEPCRKFISRSISKVQLSQVNKKVSTPEFTCVAGGGNCVVPPVLRGLPADPAKARGLDRCQACWLKLCLIGYNLEADLYDKLRSALPPVFSDLLPPAAERDVNAPPNRGQILEFNKQVPLSRPLFDGFGDEDEAVVSKAPKDSSKKAVRTVVHDRLPNGWLKKAVKRTSGKRKGFWDVFLVTPDQKVLKTAQDLKL